FVEEPAVDAAVDRGRADRLTAGGCVGGHRCAWLSRDGRGRRRRIAPRRGHRGGRGRADKARPRRGPDALMRDLHPPPPHLHRAQLWTGPPPPVAFLVGEESSLPSHTPVTRWLV